MTSRYDIIKQSPDLPAQEFHTGDTLEINGDMVFGQDHAFYRGDFPGVVFKVRGMIGDWVSLEAPGYGEIGKGHGHYGNGAIFVTPKELAKTARIISRSNEPEPPRDWWLGGQNVQNSQACKDR